MAMTIWKEMADLERRMDGFFRGLETPAFALRSFEPAPGTRPFPPPTDVFQRGDDLVIKLELPGIDPAKDVTVTLEQGHLTITGERHQKTEVKEKDYYRMESRYGTFRRYVALPEGIDEARIKAGYHDGFLEIVVLGGARAIAGPTATTVRIPVEPGKQA